MINCKSCGMPHVDSSFVCTNGWSLMVGAEYDEREDGSVEFYVDKDALKCLEPAESGVEPEFSLICGVCGWDAEIGPGVYRKGTA